MSTLATPQSPAIVLASRSVRRAQLLSTAGYQYVVHIPGFDDPPDPGGGFSRDPGGLAAELAYRKAKSVWSDVSPPIKKQFQIILGADTIVVGPCGRLMGQPRNRTEAVRMLQSLINQTHHVYTGVVLLDATGDSAVRFADSARVCFGNIRPSQVAVYLDSGGWQGKAGGYNLYEIQGRWPVNVEGDTTTVVGLPMRKLVLYLDRWAQTHPTVTSESQGL